jgi:hypothetical protein
MVIDSFVADGALLFVETIPSLSLKIIALYYRQNFQISFIAIKYF